MEPRYTKVILKAKDFEGGAGKSAFAAHEKLSVKLSGLQYGQTSSSRDVVSVAGAGKSGSMIKAEFELDEDFFSTPACSRQHMINLCGMWDHYRFLPGFCDHLYQLMPTIAHFRISVNNTAVFDGQVYYWNYRRWRFWPHLEVAVDEAAFRKGKNVLTFENLTPPFEVKPIASHGQHTSAEKLRELAKLIPPEIPANSTFNLSDLLILTRDMNDLGVLNSPAVVQVGEPFLVEVFATQEHRLECQPTDHIELLSSTTLQPGRNKLFFKITSAGTNIELKVRSKSNASVLSAVITQAVQVPEASKFLLGHILGGHLTAFPVGHQYNHEVELFRDTCQGNLVAWLTEPRKAGDYITADMLPIKDIRESKLKVAFRYYGNIPDKFPDHLPYPQEVRRMVKELGESFYALAPHERSGYMNEAIKQTKSRPEAVAMFSNWMKALMSELHELGDNVTTFVTDPSLLNFIYRREGANLAATEVFPHHLNFSFASMRGIAKMYGDAGWAAINSFECQAWGGLPTLEPMADTIDRYDEKRANLWWLSQYLLYFAGARCIYSESGAFHQVVTRHLHLDDPQLVRFRQTQRELFEFSKVHSLTSLPAAHFAFVHSESDLFCDLYVPFPQYTEASDATWERVRVAYPQLWWRSDILRGLTTTVNARVDFSDTPFGEADVFTLAAPADLLKEYRVLVSVGRHRLSGADADKLSKYVEAGGQVVVNLVDFVGDDGKLIDPKALTKLCGVKANEQNLEKEFLWEIEVVDRDYEPDYAGAHIYCIRGQGAYDGLVLGDIELQKTAKVIIRDKYSRAPFLVQNQLGKGRVWLINVARHHFDRQFQLLANRVVESVFKRVELPLRRIEGEFINHLVYSHGDGQNRFSQVFALNNDWFSEKAVHSAIFEYDTIRFGIDVRRSRVSQFFLLPELVLIPNSDRLRIDAVATPDDKTLCVDLQGLGRTDIKLCTRRVIRSIEICDAAGKLQTLNSELCVGGAELTADLAGVHRLVVRYS